MDSQNSEDDIMKVFEFQTEDSGFVSAPMTSELEQRDDDFLNKELGKLKLNDGQITGKHILEMLYGYNRYQKGNTFLHQAVLKGLIKQVLTIIKITVHPCLLNMENDKFFTALHLAVLSKRADIVRHLVLAGADINIRSKDGNTSMHMACYQNDLETLKALTQPITESEQNQYPQCQRLKYDVDCVNYEGETCLHIAAYNNSFEVLKYLVELGANINAREYLRGFTVLHITIKDNNYDLFKYLINEFPKALDYNMTNYALKTPYQYAKKYNEIFARNLIEFDTNNNSDDSDDSIDDYDNDDDDDKDGDEDGNEEDNEAMVLATDFTNKNC